MNKHTQALKLIDGIRGLKYSSLRKIFIHNAEHYVDKSAGSFYSKLMLAVGFATFILHATVLADGFLEIFFLGVLVSAGAAFFASFVSLILTKLLVAFLCPSGFFNVFGLNNVLKARKIDLEIKKQKTFELIERNDFKNKNLIKISKMVGFELDRLEPLTNNQIKTMLEKTNDLPASIKKQINQKILKLLKEGHTLRQNDSEAVDNIIEVFSGGDMEMVDIMENMEKEILRLDALDMDTEIEIDDVISINKTSEEKMGRD